MELSAWFENFLFGDRAAKAIPRVVTIIGSGGKTSLIWRLAASLSPGRRVLVTPTAKMLVPRQEEKLYDRYCNTNLFCDGLPPAPVSGITLAGMYNEETGKLEPLPLPALSALIPDYDLVLLEGDGSKGFPLKAWADYEPVVPAFTTLTVGVLPVWPLGRPISENLIHRLPLFLALTGASDGETLKPEHLLTLVTGSVGKGESGPGGLFAKAQGRRLLFFNQVEDDEALKQARELVSLLPAAFRESLCGVIAGSVQKNWVFNLK